MHLLIWKWRKHREANELETTYKLNSKGQACLLFPVYGLSGIVLQISPAYLLACSVSLEWGSINVESLFFMLLWAITPFFSPSCSFYKLSWLLIIPGVFQGSLQLAGIADPVLFLECPYFLFQNFSAWLSLLLSNQCPAWRKSFSHQVELGQLTGWVNPTKEFFPTQWEWCGQLVDRTLQS